ncbi:MAG: hypothetical protein ACK5YI_00155 [Rhodospirillales bacterium]
MPNPASSLLVALRPLRLLAVFSAPAATGLGIAWILARLGG